MREFYFPDLDTPERRRRRAAVHRLEMRVGLLPALRLIGRLDWLPYGVRYRIANLFCRFEYSSSVPFEVDFFGLTYPGDLSSRLDWVVYFFGAHEKAALFLLRDLLLQRRGGVFVDIGANAGHHTLFMAKWAKVVHAFEPWDVVRSLINKKIERNKLTNVVVHPVGLGERHDWLPYYAPLGSNTGTGSFNVNHAVQRNRPLGKLELVNGDEYFEANGISNIDLVKIDAEGWELYILRGLRKTLARSNPPVFLEVSETTLTTLNGPEGFRQCLPDCYEAVYVDFTRKGVKYSQFDASRPGDVLLRAR